LRRLCEQGNKSINSLRFWVLGRLVVDRVGGRRHPHWDFLNLRIVFICFQFLKETLPHLAEMLCHVEMAHQRGRLLKSGVPSRFLLLFDVPLQQIEPLARTGRKELVLFRSQKFHAPF
jgi:hypothetical protein